MDAKEAEVNAEEVMLQAFAEENSQKKTRSAAAQPLAEIQTAQFQQAEPSPSNGSKDRKLDMLMDLSLQISIELGRTTMFIKDILNLQRGSVVEFEKLASEPVDILINGKKMAEGEVVVIEKHFGIRITSLVDTSERLKSLGK